MYKTHRKGLLRHYSGPSLQKQLRGILSPSWLQGTKTHLLSIVDPYHCRLGKNHARDCCNKLGTEGTSRILVVSRTHLHSCHMTCRLSSWQAYCSIQDIAPEPPCLAQQATETHFHCSQFDQIEP